MKTLLILVAVLAAPASGRGLGKGALNGVRRSDKSEADWGYGHDNGPDTWPNTYPTCGGSRQSPVALDTSQALLNTSLAPFQFTGYDVLPSYMEVTNTGHAVQVNAVVDASVSGGGLPGRYTFSQFHFHFGAGNHRGSEHTVEGERFAAELHLVHYLESYGSFDEAANHDGGVAVLSVVLGLAHDDNPLLAPIDEALEYITNSGESASIAAFPLRYVLPTNTDSFFRYEGSLTTPECNEVVVWTVFREPIPISADQLEEFRALTDAHGKLLADNYRPLQELNGRKVYMS